MAANVLTVWAFLNAYRQLTTILSHIQLVQITDGGVFPRSIETRAQTQ